MPRPYGALRAGPGLLPCCDHAEAGPDTAEPPPPSVGNSLRRGLATNAGTVGFNEIGVVNDSG